MLCYAFHTPRRMTCPKSVQTLFTANFVILLSFSQRSISISVLCFLVAPFSFSSNHFLFIFIVIRHVWLKDFFKRVYIIRIQCIKLIRISFHAVSSSPPSLLRCITFPIQDLAFCVLESDS